MELAIVLGQCTATVKDASLGGRKLAVVQGIDPSGATVRPAEVALDITGAAAGQTVLLARGSAARQPADNRQLASDLSIVAIVDEITVASSATSRAGTTKTPASRSAGTRTSKTRTRTTRNNSGGK